MNEKLLLDADKKLRDADRLRAINGNLRTATQIMKTFAICWIVIGLLFMSELSGGTLTHDLAIVSAPILGMLLCVTTMFIGPVAAFWIVASRIIRSR